MLHTAIAAAAGSARSSGPCRCRTACRPPRARLTSVDPVGLDHGVEREGRAGFALAPAAVAAMHEQRPASMPVAHVAAGAAAGAREQAVMLRTYRSPAGSGRPGMQAHAERPRHLQNSRQAGITARAELPDTLSRLRSVVSAPSSCPAPGRYPPVPGHPGRVLRRLVEPRVQRPPFPGVCPMVHNIVGSGPGPARLPEVIFFMPPTPGAPWPALSPPATSSAAMTCRAKTFFSSRSRSSNRQAELRRRPA